MLGDRFYHHFSVHRHRFMGVFFHGLAPMATSIQPLRGRGWGRKILRPRGCGTLLPVKRRHTIVCLYILFNSFNPLIHQWPDLRFAKTSFNFLYLLLTSFALTPSLNRRSSHKAVVGRERFALHKHRKRFQCGAILHLGVVEHHRHASNAALLANIHV